MKVEKVGLFGREIVSDFDPKAEIVVAPGDCIDTLRALPAGIAKLIITSPPYNLCRIR